MFEQQKHPSLPIIIGNISETTLLDQNGLSEQFKKYRRNMIIHVDTTNVVTYIADAIKTMNVRLESSRYENKAD